MTLLRFPLILTLSRSLNDFITEDIEKMNNVSFSDPEYRNKVLLVVNLASF